MTERAAKTLPDERLKERLNRDGQDEQDKKGDEISAALFFYPVHPVHPCLNLCPLLLANESVIVGLPQQ